MSASPSYLHKRREMLNTLGLCQRCGTSRPEDGKKHCPSCLRVKSLKGNEARKRANPLYQYPLF
jgi:uncharacterized Zn finger protein (UPF0148 family)